MLLNLIKQSAVADSQQLCGASAIPSSLPQCLTDGVDFRLCTKEAERQLWRRTR